MDHGILKKRLNTFKSSRGTLRSVSDEVIIEVLRAWENWPGTSADLYRELGLSKMQLVSMIQKAKRLVKSGAIVESDFKEIKLEETKSYEKGSAPIVLKWKKDNLIKFYQVDHLVEFLKKAA